MNDKLEMDYLTGKLEERDQPIAVHTKFDPSGAPLINPGNTFICHINQTSRAYYALVAAQDALKKGVLKKGLLADAFTFLPPESFHMTIFPAIIDHNRTLGHWPDHFELQAPINDVTKDFETRLKEVALPKSFCIKLNRLIGGFSLSVSGADADQERQLRSARDQLRDFTHIHGPEHDIYQFHITFAYLIRWLTRTEAQDVIAHSDEVFGTYLKSIENIQLGAVEFCTFDTMHKFHTRAYI